MRYLIAGNWKMHGSRAQVGEISKIDEAAQAYPDVDIALCLPATLIAMASDRVSTIAIGAQDCHHSPHGAHTGCLSAPMLIEAGASMVIVGHSERRADQGETNADVRAKAEAALAAGMMPIICVGETETQRDAGQAETVVASQLCGSVPAGATRFAIAYEPVWAIGTGLTPLPDDIAAIHKVIRRVLCDLIELEGDNVHILYGGSVKPANAAELMAIANVNGALVGGASLTAADFVPIIAAAQAIALETR